MRIVVVHGPNLNLLGTREPDVYGTETLAAIDDAMARFGAQMGVEVAAFQSNHEGALIDHIQREAATADGFVVNGGAYTHTSVALADALVGVARPFVEVHLSNVFSREGFRHHSYLAPRALGVVSGFGAHSYTMGLWALVEHLKERGVAPQPDRDASPPATNP